MKILQICPRVPFPPTDGGAIAMYDLAKGLSESGHEVTVLAINTPKHFQENDVIEDFARLETVFVDTKISGFHAFLNLFRKIPYNVERFVSKDFEIKLTQLLSAESFDVVQFEGTFVAYYIDLVKQLCNSRTVLRVHNLEYRIWNRMAHQASGFKKWYFNYLAKGIEQFEQQQFQKFDVLASISSMETEEMIRKKYNRPMSIKTIPAGVDFSRFSMSDEQQQPEPKTLFILSALNWMPNIESVHWFVQEVMPKLRIKDPEITLHIAGKDTPQEIFDLANDHIKVHGFVESAAEFMNTYQLMLVPLLSGGGMRIKIIEGMAMGKCILSSSVGAEGINYEEGKDIFICNEPGEWVDTITSLLNAPETILETGNNAANKALEYDNKAIIRLFEEVYNTSLS